ncbi:MAG: hypothetical protein H8E44_48240 [Planctomycetes bacterium]|nr:hypothetical protein [Planctomycetota bacterium]MBL7038480.1 hypothetical protein [Pirellulaceae bacterium]
MNTERFGLIVLIFSLSLASGCAAFSERLAMFDDMIRFRGELGETRREMRRAELEAERRELETLRRAELREMKRDMVQMVPELKAAMQTTLNQKIANIRLKPDYAAMAKAAETLAKLEEENERVYQEELAEWLREQSEYERQQAKYASWRRPFCPKHGHNCDCKQKEEPSCAKPPAPPRAPLREMPKKPVLPKLPVKYAMEFDMEADVEGWEFIEAQPGRAPLKERCLPEKGNGPKQKRLFHSAQRPDDDAPTTSLNVKDELIPPKPLAEDDDSAEENGSIIRASMDFTQ